jgi:hemerythrin
MPLLAWEDRFLVGNDEIDGQHKRLLELINSVYDVYVKGDEGDKLYEIIYGLIDYAAYHFKTEEEYMEQFKNEYAEYKLHKEEHNDFIVHVVNYFVDYAEGRVQEIPKSVLDYLVKWFTGHTTGTDKRFALFLGEKGIV